MKNSILKNALLTISFLLFFSCTKDEIKAKLPSLITVTISNTTPSTANINVTIANDGGAQITDRGVCWSTNPSPSIALSTKTNYGTGIGTFTGQLTNLTPKTTYYIRAYATNNVGTAYSDDISFTTLDITTGLVAYYPFNGNANDESGNGNNGIVNGSVSLTTDRNNTQNSAYSWPKTGGSSNFISIGNIHNFLPNSLTVSAWIYMDGGSLGPRIISSGEVGIGTPVTTNSSRTFDVNYATSQINSVSIPALSWQHIVYTFNATNGDSRFYVNGVQTNYVTGGTRTVYNYVNWNIGRKSISGYDGWGGKIDNVGIWNRALTSTEIQNLYALNN